MPRTIAALVLLAGAAPLAHAQSPPVPSHCRAGEQVVFSCNSSAGKTISVCASGDLSAAGGTLQYRYGRIGQPPELAFPDPAAHPKASFLSGTLAYSRGGGAYLRFKRGSYDYTVFTALGDGWAKEGVVVRRDGRQLTYVACAGRWQSRIGPEFFDQAGLMRDNEAFELP